MEENDFPVIVSQTSPPAAKLQQKVLVATGFFSRLLPPPQLPPNYPVREYQHVATLYDPRKRKEVTMNSRDTLALGHSL